MVDNNTSLSGKASELFKKAFWMTPEGTKFAFEQGISEDTMAVFTVVANNVFETFLSKFPAIKDELTVTQYDELSNLLLEAVGIGYKIYYAEKVYLKNDNQFSKHTGAKYKSYLLKEFDNYFSKETKNPDDITPSYVFETAKQFNQLLFSEGISKKGLLDKKLPQECKDALLIQPLYLILMGYALSALQEQY